MWGVLVGAQQFITLIRTENLGKRRKRWQFRVIKGAANQGDRYRVVEFLGGGMNFCSKRKA